MTNTIPFPERMSFDEWTSRFISAFSDQFISKPIDGEHWTIWAQKLFLSTQFYQLPKPSLLAYPKDDDWKLWASQVILLLE